jgi:hypothetical protein
MPSNSMRAILYCPNEKCSRAIFVRSCCMDVSFSLDGFWA